MLVVWLLGVLSGITAVQPVLYADTGVRVIESSPARLEVEYRPVVQGWDTVEVQGERTILPRIAKSSSLAGRSGEPMVVGVEVPFTVPSASGFTLAEISVQKVQAHQGTLTPVSSIGIDDKGNHQVSYKIDGKAYNNATPSAWSEVEYHGIMRDRHIAFLRFRAIQYDGRTHTIQMPEAIRVVITFTPSQVHLSIPAATVDMVPSLNSKETVQWRIAGAQVRAKRSVVTSEEKQIWVRIGVESEGVYALNSATLGSAGVTIPANQIQTIRVFSYGGRELPEKVSGGLANELVEQPIIVRTTSSGELESVLFYGASPSGFDYSPTAKGEEKFAHYINHYSRKNYYLLTFGNGNGLRATSQEVPNGTVVHSPAVYTARTFVEEELYNPFSPGGDRRWFGRIANKDIPNTYTTMLPNIVRESGRSVFYRYGVVNRANSTATFLVTENGSQIQRTGCSGINPNNHEFAYAVTDIASVPTSAINGDRSVLQFLYTSSQGGQSASGYIDWFEIHYPRAFVPLNSEIEFYSEPDISGITEYTVNEFNGDVLGFDVTNRAMPKLIKNLATTGGIFRFRVEHQPELPQRFYIASALKAPVSVEKTDVGGLRTAFANTDVILVTNKNFLPSAQVYKQYRESRGELSVSVVTTEQIFNEFAGGMPDPTAIRDFFAFALRNWDVKPRYAILWGDGHYDYRNISTNEPVYVPTYQTLSQDGIFSSVTTTSMIEDYFARVAGDDALVDIALGRIPIRSDAEGMTIVEKIKHYETESSADLWRTRISLIADDAWTTEYPNGEGLFHVTQSETLSQNYIPLSIYQKKVYLPEYAPENIPGGRRKPKVMDEIVNTVNRGTLILNWIGHGNPRVWAHEQVFDKDVTIPLMNNRDKLFFLTAATCDFGRIDDPARQSGAEELFSRAEGGAIGVFSATRTVYSEDNSQLNQAFYSNLFSLVEGRYLRLGDALFRTKQGIHGSLFNDQKFFLLGDPTVRLLTPPQTIRITSINDIKVSEGTTAQLKALSTVKIAGEVLAVDGITVDKNFNGSVVFSLYDSDVKKVVKDVGVYIHNYSVFGGLLSVTADSVRRGIFTATMVVPQDISFSDQAGRLNGYAFSPTAFAKGATQDFTVGGVDTSAVNDKRGPIVEIFVDTYTFRAGDLVQPIPKLIVDLYDETGINATGLGIGHDIEVWIDDAPNPIQLTRDFTISLDNFRKGTAVKELFGLAPGTHRLRVRAWDVFNNFSEAETYFRIVGSDNELVIEDLFNYPNPFSETTTIAFRHNQLGTVEADVVLSTIDGKQVRKFAQSVSTRSATLLWDGKDEDGSYLPNGVYLYKLRLSARENLIREKEGKLVIYR